MKLVASDVLGMVLSHLQACGYDKVVKYLKKHMQYDDSEVFVVFKSLNRKTR
jgi:hypothetical protein